MKLNLTGNKLEMQKNNFKVKDFALNENGV